jgi:hypothetical protein
MQELGTLMRHDNLAADNRESDCEVQPAMAAGPAERRRGNVRRRERNCDRPDSKESDRRASTPRDEIGGRNRRAVQSQLPHNLRSI